MKISYCLLFMIFLLTVNTFGASVNEYIDEFSNPGEVCNISQVYNYWTLNGQEMNVAVYTCFNDMDSTPILFDISNTQNLTLDQATSFFEFLAVKERTEKGIINESIYDPNIFNETDGTIICDKLFGLPNLREEVVNVGAEFSEKAADFLPENSKAQLLVISLVRNGKKIGIIKEVSYAALTLGVVCQGSKVYDHRAINYLATCQRYIAEIKKGVAYEGEIDDLKECHNNVIKKIDRSTKYSVNMWVDEFETQGSNQLKKFKRFFACLFNKCESIKLDESKRDLAKRKLDDLKEKIEALEVSEDSRLKAGISNNRILEKEKEARNNLVEVEISLIELEEKTKKCDRLWSRKVFNIYYEPNCNLDYADSNITEIKTNVKHNLEKLNVLRYNSVINTSQNNKILLNRTKALVGNEVSQERRVDFGAVLLTFSFVLITFFIVLWIVVYFRDNRFT